MEHKSLAKRIGLAGMACALCASVGVGTAFAYYTDTTNAQGTLSYSLAPSTDFSKEEITAEGKTIAIENTTDAPCMVRVKLFFAEKNVSVNVRGDKWAQLAEDDGWFYYTEPLLTKGACTEDLLAVIEVQEGANDVFDVTVVQECVAAYWDGGADDGCYVGDFVVSAGDGDAAKAPIKVTDMKPIPGASADAGVAIKGFTMTADKTDNGTEGN